MNNKELQKLREQAYNSIPPTKRRILEMSHDVLIGHYNLIQIKKSSLLRTQRDLVCNRINYLLSKGKITEQQIDAKLALVMKLQDGR